MKILVTGGNGQLGCSLRKISAQYPAYDFIFSDLPEVDITDEKDVSRLINENDVEVVINCAAYTAVDKAESEPELAGKINVEGPRVLAEIMRKREGRLIHISTDYVFGGCGCSPLREDSPTDPQGVYGKTKLTGEQAVINSGCAGAVIRTAWLYSEFGSNFVKTMLRLGRERDSINVVYDQIGTPTYATDLAHAIMCLLEKSTEQNTPCEVYHFSNEGAVSWYDFAQAVFELAGLQIKVGAIETAQYPTPARRPAYSVLSKNKIKASGITVPYWRESLARCLNVLLEK